MEPEIVVSSGLKRPTVTELNGVNYVFRAGVIPYAVVDDEIYFLLGKTREVNFVDNYDDCWNQSLGLNVLFSTSRCLKNPSLYSDFGGGKMNKETTFQCILRELNEESRGLIKINLADVPYVFIHGNIKRATQLILLAPLEFCPRINDRFTNILPTKDCEDELSSLEWVKMSDFLDMPEYDLTSALANFRELLLRHPVHIDMESYNQAVNNKYHYLSRHRTIPPRFRRTIRNTRYNRYTRNVWEN